MSYITQARIISSCPPKTEDRTGLSLQAETRRHTACAYYIERLPANGYVEGKEVEKKWREQGCWEWNRWWRAERKEGEGSK